MNDKITKEEALYNYVLHRADTNLILGQRLSAWCGHGPVLEQDIALTNVALDLVGQARAHYQYAAQLSGNAKSEDDLAFLRDEREFMNPLLCEVENGDWGQTIMRQFLFDAHHFLLLTRLKSSSDDHLAALATKSLKEVTYHRRYSGEWVVRLGDGTDESHLRMQRALDGLWKYTGELLSSAPIDIHASSFELAPKPEELGDEFHQYVKQVFAKANLVIPEISDTAMRTGGKSGIHSEKMGYLLAEMQYLQRSNPGATW